MLSVILMLFMASCADDDTSWKKEIEDIKQQLSNQKSLFEALGKNAYVTSIKEYSNYYTVNFSNGQSLVLTDGKTPLITIGEDGNWYIDGVNTNKPSQGASPTISIGDDGYWYINGFSTNLKAEDGHTPTVTIGDDGYWYIDSVSTNRKAQGEMPIVVIGQNGNWTINGEDTGIQAEGKDGISTPTIECIVVNGYTLSFNFTDNTTITCFAELDNSDKYNLAVLSDNPIQSINYTPGFTSIFRTWGFIGDSFCSGWMELKDSTGTVRDGNHYEYSWGQCLCRMTGSTGENFSTGGQWTTSWLVGGVENRAWPMAQLYPKQAYIIALGYNDLYSYPGWIEKGDLSTDVNLNDYSQNAVTYAGNMAGIIQRLKTVNKNAVFFVVTLPKEPNKEGYATEEWNDIVRQLPNLFDNTYVIDLYKYAPVYDDEFRSKYYSYGHMNAAGYQYTAYMFATYIDWIIRNNPSKFTYFVMENN